MAIYFQSIFLLTQLSPSPCSCCLLYFIYVAHFYHKSGRVQFWLYLTNIKHVAQAQC